MNFGKVRISVLTVLLVSSINLFAQNTTGTVDFDINTLHDMNQITVSLSDNTTLIINKKNVFDKDAGAYVWTGEIIDHPEGMVVISVGNGIATGIIETLTKVWDIKITQSSSQPVNQIDDSLLNLPIEEGRIIDSLIFKNDFESNVALLKKSNQQCADANNGIIDVLVVYTQQAADSLSGISIKEHIEKAVAMANEDFDTSLIPWQYNLVGTSLVNSSHIVSGDDGVERMSDTLFGRLVPNPNNNFFDDVHELRNTTKADLVLLMVDFGGGEARALLNIENPEPEKAYAMMNVNQVYYHTFSHELGHLLGAHHNREQRSDTNGYNFGFTNCDGANWRTIMSYPDVCIFNTPRKGIFSSNLIEYNNQSTGDEITDNRRIIMEGAATAACYRDSRESRTGAVKVSWFLNGSKKQIIPNGFSGEILHLFTWWGNHSIKMDLDNNGVFDFDFNEVYPELDVDPVDLYSSFNNGFSLQDYKQWTSYWVDDTHGVINCWDSNCIYNPLGAGALMILNESGFSCDNNVWKYQGQPVGNSELYCKVHDISTAEIERFNLIL